MNNLNFKKILPYLIAAVLFIIIAYTYCSPALEGKNIQGGDTYNAQAAYQEGVQYSRKSGDKNVWWTGSMFSGMPNYQIGGGSYASSRALKPFTKILVPPQGPRVIILYFVCFFCLLLAFKVDKWVAIAGALAIGMSSYFFVIIPAGHYTKSITIPLISVVIAGFYMIFRKNYLAGVPIVMLFMALGFHRHPQMSYYLFMMIGLLWCAELAIHVKEKRYKDFGISTALFAFAVLVGIYSNAANTLANQEYVKETMRGGHSDLLEQTVQDQSTARKKSGLDYDYAMAWSYGKVESLSFLIPGIQGSASTMSVGENSHLYQALIDNRVQKKQAAQYCNAVPLYWGDQPFTSGNVYMGAIVCFLFVLGILIVKGPYKWALFAAALFSTLLSWGTNVPWLSHLFFDHFPLFNKFRAISSILVVAEIAMPLLGFLAVKSIMDGEWEIKKLNKRLYIAAGITGGICFVIWIFAGAFFDFQSAVSDSWKAQMPDWYYNAILKDRESLARADSFRSMIFILLAAGLVWLYANEKVEKKWLAAGLGLLVLFDMWPVDRRYFNKDNFADVPNAITETDKYFPIQAYERQILADKDPHFRVLNLASNTFNDARTSVRLKSIGGYSAAKLRRYQDIIDVYLSGQQPNIKIAGMLNGKYVIMPNEQGQATAYRNNSAMGNAWFVDNIQIADTPKEECYLLDNVDLHKTAVVGKDFQNAVAGFQSGDYSGNSITLTHYTPKSLMYSCNASKDGIAVFSEIFYPYGWKAFIDGKPADLFRTDYLLRGIRVPAGTHEISMIFAPDSIRKGNTISVILITFIYLSIAGAIAYRFLRKRKETASE